MSTTICVHTAHSNGRRNRDQEIELMEPAGPVDDECERVEPVDRHTSQPTQPEDSK
ncbi:hypothetical protein [Halococcoides cellulosivorans]|uniref:hypothetical protein n=1 Tax=Halococcoides cellulosivorans TaxID=1679096 RepID=UPI00131F3956|nr:hypothetical protein [Halococcoides cellulosivorans]